MAVTAGKLNLVFPQWQGSGKRKYLYHGAKMIAGLLEGEPYREVGVSTGGDIRIEKGIWGHSQIVEQLAHARKIIEEERPDKIFLIGGDCGTEIAPVSYLNQRYCGDLAVLWLDAHGDLNAPFTSSSHNFHGMPLRYLLGEADEALGDLCFSTLRPTQVILCGVRELDQPEAEFIEKKRIRRLSVGDIEEDPWNVARIITAKGLHNVYFHIDVDVLDSGKCPWGLCPAPDGIGTGALMALLEDVRSKISIAGISVLELKPEVGMNLEPVRDLIRFGKEI